jgi:small GTP-binding protein
MQKNPTIAIVGFPNSGKSTLLNRLTGKKAIVAMEAHTTRDLNYGEDFWDGLYLKFIDTGGIVPDPQDKIQKAVQIKSWGAIAEADLLLWVIDRNQDPETLSQNIIQRLWKTGKPFIVAVNKVDDPNKSIDIAGYAFLGAKDYINISCNIGLGLSDLMDSIVENLLKLGFEKNLKAEYEGTDYEKFYIKKLKEIERAKDGKYYVVRADDGLFQSVTNYEKDEDEIAKVENLICDLNGVLISTDLESFISKEVKISNQKAREYINQLTNLNLKPKDIKFWEELSILASL